MKEKFAAFRIRLSPYLTLKNINYTLAGIVVVLGLSALYVLSSAQPAYQMKAKYEDSYSPPDSNEHEIRSSSAMNTETQKYGDWGLECVNLAQGQSECHLFQRMLWNDNKEEAMLAHVLLTRREGHITPRIRLIAPLGSFLPPGIRVRLGNLDEVYAPFQYCIQGGCFVNLDISDEVVSEISKNKSLIASYVQPEGGAGNIEISLKGFSQGIKALTDLEQSYGTTQ